MIKLAILAAVIAGLGGSLAKACGSSSKVAAKNADELVEPAARAVRHGGDEALAPAAAAGAKAEQEAAKSELVKDVAVEGAGQAAGAVAEGDEREE